MGIVLCYINWTLTEQIFTLRSIKKLLFFWCSSINIMQAQRARTFSINITVTRFEARKYSELITSQATPKAIDTKTNTTPQITRCIRGPSLAEKCLDHLYPTGNLPNQLVPQLIPVNTYLFPNWEWQDHSTPHREWLQPVDPSKGHSWPLSWSQLNPNWSPLNPSWGQLIPDWD